jgi:DNA-binding NarL/FixJ family response regulator
MPKHQCRVLIADDHPVVRQGIKQILNAIDGITVSGEAQSGDELLKKVRGGGWDILVMDLNMPGPHGLDLLRQIKRDAPDLPILVLSVHPEDQLAVRLLKAGASGYIAKENAPDELIAAIRKICAGGTYVSASLAEALAEGLRQPSDQPPHKRLSDREYQVLLLMGAGHSPTEIATQLHLSIKTISTYRARILDKMQLRSSAQIIQYVIREGLLPNS